MGDGTPIGKVRGLGSAHHGAQHWLVQRITAVANLVLMVWLLGSFILLPDLSYDTMIEYLSNPVPAFAMIALIITLFWHAHHGLQVLIEDYVSTAGNRFAVMALLNLATIGGAAFGIFSILRIMMLAQGNSAAGDVLSVIQNQMGGR